MHQNNCHGVKISISYFYRINKAEPYISLFIHLHFTSTNALTLTWPKGKGSNYKSQSNTIKQMFVTNHPISDVRFSSMYSAHQCLLETDDLHQKEHKAYIEILALIFKVLKFSASFSVALSLSYLGENLHLMM